MGAYVRTIPPAVLAALPKDCQKALADSDIQQAAVGLLHCDLSFKGSDQIWDTLHEISLTFSAATLRLTRLHRDPLS